MIDGARLDQLIKQRGRSQSWLARAVGLDPSTINGLVKGDQRSSSKLHLIAERLQTSIAYLEGRTDDPDADASPAPPTPPYQAVTLQVLLPGEDALAQMFFGLLSGIDELPRAEQARHLARRLPSGLSQLRDLLPVEGKQAGATPLALPSIPAPAPQ